MTNLQTLYWRRMTWRQWFDEWRTGSREHVRYLRRRRRFLEAARRFAQ